MSDEETPRYLGDFRQAVRRLLGPKENGWSSALYTDEDAIAQALRKAYWEGRFDGVDSVLGHPAAPGAVDVEEEPLETREQAWERLGLFPAPTAPPGSISAYLEAWRSSHAPAEGEAVEAWAVRECVDMGMTVDEAAHLVLGMVE